MDSVDANYAPHPEGFIVSGVVTECYDCPFLAVEGEANDPSFECGHHNAPSECGVTAEVNDDTMPDWCPAKALAREMER